MSNIQEYLKKAGKFIYKYKFTVLCLSYFCTISILSQYIVSKPAIINALSFILVLNILAKTKYSLWLSLILSFFISFDAYFAFVYSNKASIGTMASILETNATEAGGVLSEVIFIALACLAASIFLILMSQRELKESKFTRKSAAIMLLIYWIVVMPAIGYWKIKALKWEYYVSTFPVISLNNLVGNNFPLVYIDIANIVAYMREKHHMKLYMQLEKQMPDGISFNSQKESPKKIFFIIGESASRKHYSLYGYKEKTSPFLDSLAQIMPDDLHYYDAYSPASITRDALRLILSFSTPQNIQPFYDYFNVIDMANIAGYETIWISNQDKVGESESYIGYVASNATQSFYGSSFIRDDFNLLPYLEKVYIPGKKQFFAIHLNGSHVPYGERYDEIDVKALPGANTKTREYDRSLHHTDRLLEKIYKIMKRENSSILYYFSDHAELVEGGGHGVLVMDHNLFDTPLVTINNSTVPVDSIVKKYIDPEMSLINNSNSTYIMSEIMGYDVLDKNVKKAIEDGQYIFHVDKSSYLYKDLGPK
ncbi:sulfatase-like hydrolase/transferase [Prevotella sp. 10(H)]|uniref:sulfatase-like hydrolase/transferase n=1 Tax=Prevotella sp. 10(H) TaxID=1158294 RepID=UPI0004A6A970|nr:sulfatase-like hydrolase/transferase [Prevotella sp. 10(H)]